VETMVDERLSVFDDEPDLNDWVEVMCGAAMVVLGMFHLIQPGELVNPDVMRWFSAAVVAAGGVWAGHGLKDMAVKEIRRSIAILEMSESEEGPDHGLIRDVLLNPTAYSEFLLESYAAAWEDGIITEEELKELRSFQEILGITDEDAAKMNLEAAISSAAKDGKSLLKKKSKSRRLHWKQRKMLMRSLKMSRRRQRRATEANSSPLCRRPEHRFCERSRLLPPHVLNPR